MTILLTLVLLAGQPAAAEGGFQVAELERGLPFDLAGGSADVGEELARELDRLRQASN